MKHQTKVNVTYKIIKNKHGQEEINEMKTNSESRVDKKHLYAFLL